MTNAESIMPCVHSNGSGAAALMEQAEDCITTLKAAQEALRSAAPHGRDFYPLGDEAFSKARDQWRETFRSVSNSLEFYRTQRAKVRQASRRRS
jgi:hypothetical protein